MSKKIYKLRDIEKLLTFIPPIFILVLAIISMIISYLILEHQEKSKINLLQQKENFISQNKLKTYVNIVDKNIKIHLNDVQKELKKSVYTLSGIYQGIYINHDKSPTDRLKNYIKEIEINNNVNFVVFDKNQNILYGSPLIENIEELIFSKKNDKQLLKITLLYIQSQGKSSSFSWKNDLSKTIQLSYFLLSDDGQIYIGAFSSIDSLKNLTFNAYISSIRDDKNKPNDFYFWLYDKAEKKTFNYKNYKKWAIIHKINTLNPIFNIKKYFLTIGISRSIKIDKISKIKRKYANKKMINFAIIFFIASFLIVVTSIFSTFIKRIFSRYDLKLKTLVKEEVAKNQEKEKLLIQQNKLAAMGEMIGSIAHQWRQPLNNISLILHFIRDNVRDKNFIDTMLHEYVDKAKKQIAYMSDTIDDFSDFYKPSKNKDIFNVKEAIKSSISIMQTQLDKHDISINISENSLHVYGHENEFKQAILNILANAKDAITQKMKENTTYRGKITITIDNNITIFNDGGNASKEVLERMFEPYFTTKFEDKGTGIGLYMTRTIIENSIEGEIYAKNYDDGVLFGIIFSDKSRSRND